MTLRWIKYTINDILDTKLVSLLSRTSETRDFLPSSEGRIRRERPSTKSNLANVRQREFARVLQRRPAWEVRGINIKNSITDNPDSYSTRLVTLLDIIDLDILSIKLYSPLFNFCLDFTEFWASFRNAAKTTPYR